MTGISVLIHIFEFKISYLIFFLVLIAFLYFQHFSKKIQYRNVTKKLPTIYGLPFIGIGYQFLPMKKFLYVIGNHFETLKSSTYCAWLGLNPFVITVDPDVVKTILTSEEFLVKARSIYTSIDNALPNGIMTSNGEKWKHNRRLLNFSFSHKILKNLMPVFNKGSRKATERLSELNDSKEHKIFDLIKNIILQIAVESTMGIELKTGDKMDEKVSKGFNFMLQQVAREMIYNCVHLGFLVHTPKYYRQIQFLRNYAANLINHKYTSKESKKKINTLPDDEEATHEIFIKQAMSYQERGLFVMDDVISETHTMIAGSFDTISTSIFSIIVLLAMHQDIQEKLYKEVCCILPTSETEIYYENMKQVPYMDMVIDEALRLMPSIPVIARETDKDIKLTEDLVLPKGMQVMISIFTLHRRKDIWGPNANDFDPDNFLPENINKRHPYAYLPFSKGPRNCLGLRYAHFALRVLLLTLVRNFKFSTTFKYHELVFLDNLSLRYDVEPPIKVEKRVEDTY